MVWVTFHLALHPECQDIIRDELNETLEDKNLDGVLNLPALKGAVRTDSFIREVLRMKGDGVNAVRMTARDVELGGYMLPKGSNNQTLQSKCHLTSVAGYLVFPVTFLSYRSSDYIEDSPDDFKAMRWLDTGKTAAMTGPGYLAFGLGKWACPGRFLAIAGNFFLFFFSVLEINGLT